MKGRMIACLAIARRCGGRMGRTAVAGTLAGVNEGRRWIGRSTRQAGRLGQAAGSRALAGLMAVGRGVGRRASALVTLAGLGLLAAAAWQVHLALGLGVLGLVLVIAGGGARVGATETRRQA